MRHVGVKLATFACVDYFFCHLICSWPIKSCSVCFGHNGPRGRMMTTGPRVDVIEDRSTFFWSYAFLADSSHTFPEQLSSYHSKGFGSTDDLSSLFFILWKSFLRMYAMYGTVQSGVMTRTSMIRSTTPGTSTSVGSVALLGYGGSSVKGSS